MNKKMFTPLFVLASFLLIGCSADKIIARPGWINENIVDGDFKNNKMKEIYDAIKELGDTNNNVLNKVMYDIAKKHLGTFEELKTIATGTPTDEEINTFVEAHPIYKSENKVYKLTDPDPDKRTVEEKDISDDPHMKASVSKNKIIRQYKRIVENIYESLFNDIKGGEYSSNIDKLFEEEYFVEHLYKEMYFKGPMPSSDAFAKDRVFIPKPIGDENTWEDYVNTTETEEGADGFLQVSTHWGGEDANNWYGEYIERKILPEIYRTLLIENYVKEQRYTNLGRSYARKVKTITVPHNSDPNINIKIINMLNYFAENAYSPTNGWENYNLEYIGEALNGFAVTDTPAEKLLTSGGNFEALTLPTTSGDKQLNWEIRTDENGLEAETTVKTLVYRGTKLFDLVEKYLKIMDYTYDTDFHFYLKSYLTADELTAYNDLTNNGTITVERGLVLKEREIRLNSIAKDGWFLKSGGLTDLNETFRNELFNIRTAKCIDDAKKIIADEPEINDNVIYFGGKESEKGQYPNRKAFIFDKYNKDDPEHSIILDDGKTNYYIVEVLEAGSASKFSSEDQGSYLQLKATTDGFGASNDANDEIISKVTKEVASGETYKKNAEQYYLMISNIIFYDQSVYDYFKSQFPELFK